MCNRYGYQHPLNALPDEFSELGPIRWDGLLPNAPLDQIRPTDRAPIIRPFDGALELAVIRWGLVPWFYKGPLKDVKALNTSARSETVSGLPSFRGPYARRRCLVPATQYFEWTMNPTDSKGRKLMWRFTVPGQTTFAMAGLWEQARPADGLIESFVFLTSPRGPDQSPYHDREPVVLRRDQWAEWLNPENDMAASFSGSPAGSLTVEPFTDAAST
jgi:putative SOS response-associated peptidase YedK